MSSFLGSEWIHSFHQILKEVHDHSPSNSHWHVTELRITAHFEATNLMSSFKVHNCLQKILFDLQYVQISLIKLLYNRGGGGKNHCPEYYNHSGISSLDKLSVCLIEVVKKGKTNFSFWSFAAILLLHKIFSTLYSQVYNYMFLKLDVCSLRNYRILKTLDVCKMRWFILQKEFFYR